MISMKKKPQAIKLSKKKVKKNSINTNNQVNSRIETQRVIGKLISKDNGYFMLLHDNILHKINY